MGKGIDRIILLPGLDGTGDLLDGFAQALRPDYDVQVIRYPTNEELSYANLIERAEGEIPRDKHCVLLGESFSGPIALHLAARGVVPAAGVILCAAFARYPLTFLDRLDSVFDVLPIMQIRNSPLFDRIMQRHVEEDLLMQVNQACGRVAPKVMLGRFREVMHMDATPQLESLNMPILYLRAQHDNIVPAWASHHILRRRPDVRVVEFPCSHFLLQTMPREAAETVRQFMRSPEDLPRPQKVSQNGIEPESASGCDGQTMLMTMQQAFVL